MLPTKFRFIWTSGFRGEVLKIGLSETRIAVAAMFVKGSGRNEHFIEDLPQMRPTKLQFIWPSSFRGEDF